LPHGCRKQCLHLTESFSTFLANYCTGRVASLSLSCVLQQTINFLSTKSEHLVFESNGVVVSDATFDLPAILLGNNMVRACTFEYVMEGREFDLVHASMRYNMISLVCNKRHLAMQ